MTKNGGTLTYRVGRLEKDVGDVSDDVKVIMTNHLPHMQEELTTVKTRLNLFGTLIMGALSTIIALLIGRVL